MAEENVKKRLNRAIRAAIKILESVDYKIMVLGKANVFNIEVIREKEIKKIRIVVDKITDKDKKLVKDFKLPEICTKESWCRNHSDRDFEIVIIQKNK